MFTPDDVWLGDETFNDEAVDLLSLSQIKQHVSHELNDEELGLRSLLERPTIPPLSMWHEEPTRARKTARGAR